METKQCSKCKAIKPVSEFRRRVDGPQGRQSQCKECRRAYLAANRERINKQKREHYHANADELGERQREYRKANADAIAERKREYYQANREREKARAAEWYEANRERASARSREYRQRNADKIAAHERESLKGSRNGYRQRMRKFGFEVEVCDEFTMADVIERYGAKCFHCADGDFDEIDHYPIPVSQAGPHSLDNVRPSCSACNRQSWREEIAA